MKNITQYLRYFLEIEIDATAHDALGDVLVLEKLFDRLKKKIIEQEKITEDEAIQKMIEISSHPSLFKSIKFGKHSGKSIEEIVRVDRGYLEWLLSQKIESDQIDEDWIYTLRHYLENKAKYGKYSNHYCILVGGIMYFLIKKK
jgi:DNA polymerase III epsilon subunit-like protein